MEFKWRRKGSKAVLVIHDKMKALLRVLFRLGGFLGKIARLDGVRRLNTRFCPV